MTNSNTLPAPITDTPEPLDLTLSYGRKPIRVRIEAGTPWFCASDVYAAHQLQTDRRFLATFDIAHLALVAFPSPAGPINLSAVSPLGVATIARSLPHPKDRILDGWIRNQADKLAEERGLPRLEMRLAADGGLPVKPKGGTHNWLDWLDLQRRNPVLHMLAPDMDDPALADEDTNFAPTKPEVVLSPMQLLFEAGAHA